MIIPEHWQRIRELFAQTHELPLSERKRVLDVACENEPQIRTEVESLLASHDTPDELFQPIDKSIIATATHEYESDKLVGTLVGSYRIVRLIAHGGMGEVYEAIRDDGKFMKRVAVKLVRSGLSQKEMARRFEAERQMLASLQHPSIAQLIDAGTTDDGVPYLMMEFVDGKRIDEYCDEHRLSIDERLEIFRTVCSAVHVAHQHLVVHRDIKPGNILVATDGTPKLLDFGIAKIVRDDASGGEMTKTGAGFMTPEYASPEQARGANVTTISDVYSLGVLLYKLLTGQKPYEFRSSTPFEISKTIIDTEPTKPSMKEIRISVHNAGTVKIQKTLSGDIDAMILMALRKEPHLRYQSVQEFSEDIRRYLGHIPVLARKGEASYRIKKFIQRHRAGTIAVALVNLAILGGIAGVIWQGEQAKRERDKAASVNQFLQEMMNYANPAWDLLRENQGETTVKDMLNQASKQLSKGGFTHQPEVKAELHRTLAGCYQVQGLYELAARQLDSSLSLYTRMFGVESKEVLLTTADLAQSLMAKGETKRAGELLQRILPKMQSELRNGNIESEPVAVAMNDLAAVRRWQGDPKEAEALLAAGIALQPFTVEQGAYVLRIMQGNYAAAMGEQGRIDEAVTLLRKAIAQHHSETTNETPELGYLLTVLGYYLELQNDFAEADSVLLNAERIYRRYLTPSHLRIGDNLLWQATSLYDQRMYAGAEAKVADALKIYRFNAGVNYYSYPDALGLQGLLWGKTGKPIEAEKNIRTALAIRETSLVQGCWMIAQTRGQLGEHLTRQKRYDEAEPSLLQSYDEMRQSQGDRSPRTLKVLQQLVALYRQWGKPEQTSRFKP